MPNADAGVEVVARRPTDLRAAATLSRFTNGALFFLDFLRAGKLFSDPRSVLSPFLGDAESRRRVHGTAIAATRHRGRG